MLLDGADPLFQPLDSLLDLPVRELDERAGFPELFIQIGSIVGVPPVEMHLEAFGNKLEFMPKPFGQNTGMSLRIGNVCPKCFGRRADDLLELN